MNAGFGPVIPNSALPLCLGASAVIPTRDKYLAGKGLGVQRGREGLAYLNEGEQFAISLFEIRG